MKMTQPDEFDLEAALARARRAPPSVPPALEARILADALAHQPRGALWARLLGALGGPAALGGLVSATVAGFWLGLAPPATALDPLEWIGASLVQVEDMQLADFGWDSDDG